MSPNAQNLGRNVSKAMNNLAMQGKKNARMKQAVSVKKGSAGALSVPPNHRYRRYFGIRAPGANF